jgi:phosphatidylglycerol:prolipoprotein diacylglycerol transferase
MIPTLIELGPLPVRSFGLMVALALFAGAVRLALSFKRYGIDPRLAERYVTAGGVFGLLGARLWYIGENWGDVKHHLLGAIFSSAGFTFYGGFIIGSLVVLYLARRDGTDIGRFCDSLGPCLSLGYAVGRLGCQLSGDGDYGIATNGFWGMSYSTGIVPTPPGVLVYPTPLFESTISLLVLWILSRVEVAPSALSGRFQRFGLYLVLISLERLCIEGFRVNPVVAWGMSEAQIIALVLITLGGLLMLSGSRNKAALE